MKRMVFLFAVFAATMLNAQTLCVRQGNVTYAIPSEGAGDMEFTNDGSQLVVSGRTYDVDDITCLEVTQDEVSANTVAVTYNGTEASVVVSGDISAGIDVSINGAHVCVLDNGAVTQNITYTLSGSSSSGSFYMDGKQQASFVLNGLQLACSDSSAVCIQTGKDVTIQLADGTQNTLADGLTGTDDGSDAHKAPLYVNGRSTMSGAGSLTLTGNVRHGLCTDAGLTLASGLGTITVTGTVTDGFHLNEYLNMQGGTVVITAGTDGIDVGAKSSSTDAANGTTTISGGSLTVQTAGTASKGIKSEAAITVSGGTVSVTTTGGGSYEYVDGVLDLSSAAAVKASTTFTMSGGTVSLISTGAGGKGINADGNVSVSGGDLTVVTTGDVYSYSTDDTKPQGVKSDGNITLAGGNVLVCASSSSGTAFKTDNYVYTNGATVMGVGGKATTPSTTSTCGYKKYSSVSVSAGQTLSYDGVSFTIPSIYSNSSAKVLVSSSSM